MKINGKPDGGGGGGVITELSVTSNGIYIAGAGVDGYSPIDVDVQPVLESLSVSANGTYTPGQGVDGYGQVEVSVPAILPVMESLSVTINNTYYPGPGVDGFSMVVVDVPQSVTGFTEKELTERTHVIVNLNNSASFVSITAFEDYKTLSTVNLPNCTSVGMSAFKNCEYISEISLPVCTYIGTDAFYNCYRIESMYMPNVELIDNEAFYYGKWWSVDVDFPKCRRIGKSAFYYCNISSVNLPVCSYVGDYAFNSCSILTTVSIPKCEYIGPFAFISCSLLSSIELPMCSFVGSHAFQSCGLTGKVDIPECLCIQTGGFFMNGGITEVNAPYVISLGGNVFGSYVSVSNMSVIDFPCLLSQGGNVFQSMEGITKVNLPIYSNNVWRPGYMGWNLSVVNEVSLCNKTYVVPKYSTNLGMSSLSAGVSIYVDAAMYDKWVVAAGWSSLSSLFVTEGDSTVPMLSFSDGSLYGKTECLFGNWNTSNYGIGNIAGNTVFTVSLPDCRVVDGGFEGFSKMTSVYLPECISIGLSTFKGCYKLTTVDIPKCKYIGQYAFHEAYDITSLTLAGSTMCWLENSEAFWSTSFPIYVTPSLVDKYKAASQWSNISSRIFPIPE